MSSSKSAAGKAPASAESVSKSDDDDMMDAPDSPPEQSHHNFGTQSFSSLPPASQQSNSGRVNGEGAQKVNHGAPGSSWNTKKFNEEYDRAVNTLLDSQWDHTKFGDPLLN